MSYQVFARKYRPLTFNDVLGQDHVIQTLKNAIEQNRLAHAYLFVGPRGTGKTSTARIFAKALNCSGGPKINFDPHEDVCREIAEGRSLDVLEIDGASNRGIDNIRDLRDNVHFAPSSGAFRIVYIDEVHMLTKESFNALLKTLEEPPPHVKFIFATTEPHKILPTILSRCQRFDLRPIPTETIASHLLHIASSEGIDLSNEAAFAVAKAADGGMRDAQSMLDQLVSFCGTKIDEDQVLHIFGITSRETVSTVLKYILTKELPPLLHLIHEQAEAGRDMGQILSEIIASVREVLVAKVDPEAKLDSIPQDQLAAMADIINKTKTDKILRLVEVLSETEDKMRWSSNKRLHLEMGLIKAVHALAEASISDIIKAIAGAPLPHSSLEVRIEEPSARIQAPAPSQSTITTSAPVSESSTFAGEDAIPSFTSIPNKEEENIPSSSEESESSRFMALSNEPVNIEPESNDDSPIERDPAEDTLTNQFDYAFFAPSARVAETPAPAWEDIMPTSWVQILEQLEQPFPLKTEFIRHSQFIRMEGPNYIVATHSTDIHAKETLEQPAFKEKIEELLAVLLGKKLHLVVEMNENVPPPPEEELEPVPEPTIRQQSKETPPPEQPKEDPLPQKIEESDFYKDPFIQDALEIFKARIIK